MVKTYIVTIENLIFIIFQKLKVWIEGSNDGSLWFTLIENRENGLYVVYYVERNQINMI